MKSEMGIGDDAAATELTGLLSDNTQRLTSAVSNLPALLEKKRLIDMHTSLATAILEQIKLRRLDTFFELEEKVMSGKMAYEQMSKSILDTIEDPEAGTPEDKLRLFVIFFLCSAQITDPEVEKFAAALENCGCDMAALKYLQRWKTLSKMANNPSSPSSSVVDYGGGGTKTVSMYSKLMTQASSFVMEGVKNLVVKKHNLPVTKVVEELMEIRQGAYQDSYSYYDPKILRGGEIPRAKTPFQDAVVFMVGGGNYIEYQNLMDFAAPKTSSNPLTASASTASLSGAVANGSTTQLVSLATSTAPKRVIYGCTTLVNANQMMQQLAELGHEM